jgi:hypothetical protein
MNGDSVNWRRRRRRWGAEWESVVSNSYIVLGVGESNVRVGVMEGRRVLRK